MSYKILSKRSSYLERSITFEVDGRIETVSAPASTTTFDDLIARIETEFGAASKKVGAKEPDKDAVEPEKKEPEKATTEKSSTTKTRRKSASSDKSPE